MEESAVAVLAARYATHYDPKLADRPDELAALAADARALVVRNRTQVRGRVLEAASRLECVGRLGVGLDNIDMAACKARGIAVYPATGANDLPVAEYVITAALVLLRRAWFATDAMVAGAWPRERLMVGGELSGKLLGLVGFGAIARQTAARAAALGMRVAACDPFVPESDPAWRSAERRELDDLLADADVVSLHVPLTDGTRRLLDGARLARMKPGAVLVNAARGGVVDEGALADALKSGALGGAALDVFEREPLEGEAAAIFAGVPNLILTPHIAGLTAESNVRVSSLTAENVLRHLEGRK
ncbi:3-phosphoglycerate dehydrogenase [Rhizobiales bacterium L72]|uniref:3-phosphoglycerate dehydrogenase n=2 Tax=Propylenella binzhouense TaxID=2555902 RepID=A0A964T4E7_9HYPH|nr:3-phosphoglycerate dehydrogenase [Propylenella binzhouense]